MVVLYRESRNGISYLGQSVRNVGSIPFLNRISSAALVGLEIGKIIYHLSLMQISPAW